MYRFNQSHHKIISHLLILILLLFCSSIQANEIENFHNHLDFKSITKEDGLSQSRVMCAVYDNLRGVLWLGTAGGINTYDGYKVDNNPQILVDKYKNAFVENCSVDEDNNLYFTLYTEGVLRIAADGKLSHYNHLNVKGWNEQKNISDIIPVSENEIWLASNNGIIQLNTTEIKAKVYFPKKIAAKDISRLNDDLYIASKTGFFKFNIIDKSLKNLFSAVDLSQRFHKVFTSPEAIYAGSYSEGLFKYNPTDETFERVTSSSKNVSLGIAEIDGLLLYSANNEGLKVENLTDRSIDTYTVNNSNLNGNNIYNIYDFTELNIVALATRSGLSLINKSQLLLDNYKYNKNQTNNLLPSNSIFNLTESDDTLWIATLGGIVKYSYLSKKKVYSIENNNSISNSIWALHIDNNGVLWAGTGVGLAKYNPISDQFEAIKLTNANEITDIISIEDYQDTGLWIGTFGQGLFQYFFDGNVKAFLPEPNNKKFITSSGILSLKEIDDELWLGGSVNGAAKYSYRTNEFTHYESKINNGPFDHSSVKQVFQDKKGKIWFANDNGLYFLNDQGEVIKDGIVGDELIYCIASDNNDDLYLGTNNGLIYYQVGTKAYRLLKEDGLQSNEYNARACKQLSSGKLAFGGTSGVSLFDDKFVSAVISNKNPPVVVNKFLSDDKNASLNRNKGFFKIDKDAEFLEISLSNQLFFDHFNTQYSYSINGGIQKEINALPLKIATSFLPNGDTELAVFAKNRFSNNADLVKKLQINRTLYWWQTLWGKFIISLMILFTLVCIYLIRISSLKKHNRQMAKDIKNKTAQLRNALQEKDSLFENVSHELKTPLTLILGRSEQLLKRADLNVKTHDEVKHIEASAEHLYQLVNQLLQLAEIKHQKQLKEPIDIISETHILCESLSSLAQSAGMEIIYQNNTTLATHWLELQQGAWSSIMTNLVSNAIKYCDSHFGVHVSLEVTDSEAILTVLNKGETIKAEQLEKIFSRFEQLDNKQQGQGLGLAIVKELVGNHGGSVSATSLDNETTFTVTLPNKANQISQQEAIQPLPISNKKVNNLTNKQRILIVEDNQELREFITSSLSIQFRVTAVEHGQAAIDWLASAKELPDLILSDVMMPVINGYELCEKLKQDPEYQSIPLFLLTAKADSSSVKKGFAMAADDYIAKPFNTDVLITKIGNQLATREALKKHLKANLLTTPAKLSTDELSSEPELLLNKVNKLLEVNFDDADIKSKDIAKALHMQDKTLNRKLQTHVGCSISELLREYRLNKAKQLLEKGLKPKIVCFDCGFNSVSYFGQKFKQQFGMTPSEYQQNHQTSQVE